MDVRQLADMGPSVLVASSRYYHDLREALEKTLDGASDFAHFMPVLGGTGSVRLFTHEPLEGMVGLPKGSRTASEIANELLALTAEGGARYSDDPPPDRVKGWSIRAITIRQKRAAIAEAVWV